MKKTKRLWALLLVMVMALGLITTAFAAPTIDSGRKASLSLYKYDITAASADGVWDAASYVSTGVQDDAVTDKLAQYAIQGVEFSYLRVASISTYSQRENGQYKVGVLYGFADDAVLQAIGLTKADAYKRGNGVFYFTSDKLNKALADALADNATTVKNALEIAVRNGGKAMPETDANGHSKVNGLEQGLYLVVEARVPENVISTCNPFFVSLPMTTIDGKDWNYDVTVYPKNQTGSPDLEKTVREDKNSTGKNTGSLTDIADGYHELLRRFCQHEANTRAIGFESLRDEENVCRKFFAYLDASGCHTCQDINLVNVNAFLLFIASQRKSSMDRVCNTLKHLSAYLVSIQNCCDFSAALTTRPAPRKKLRPAFSAKEVHTVVDAAAKNPSLSLRDTAMFAVAASLGLRAGDIVRLTLSDIDWIHHEIRFVQNKTGVELHLPLEASVGNAIANYILHERPKTQSPALFVRSRIPFDFMTSTAAGDRLRKYMKLSDVEYTPGDGKGFHSFRRYVASSMINQEVPIDTVKEILGHTQIGSMKAYMRISRDKLAMCALGLDGIEVVQEALL